MLADCVCSFAVVFLPLNGDVRHGSRAVHFSDVVNLWQIFPYSVVLQVHFVVKCRQTLTMVGSLWDRHFNDKLNCTVSQKVHSFIFVITLSKIDRF